MLLTLETVLSHDLKRTMLTLDGLNITYGPELIEAINNYTNKSALTPPRTLDAKIQKPALPNAER